MWTLYQVVCLSRLSVAEIALPSLSGHLDYSCCHLSVVMRTICYHAHKNGVITPLERLCTLQSIPLQTSFPWPALSIYPR
jgi:hypothetical protein